MVSKKKNNSNNIHNNKLFKKKSSSKSIKSSKLLKSRKSIKSNKSINLINNNKSNKSINLINNSKSKKSNKLTFGKDGILDPEGKYPNPFTGYPASNYYKSMALTTSTTKPWSHYQPWKDAKSILQMIHNNQIILVIASTGVGKTVIFPKLLSHYFNYNTPIIITIPRQKITGEAAEFAAKLMDVPLFKINQETGEYILDEDGNKVRSGMYYVGYRHGDEKTMSDKTTKILFATDSLIKQIIQRDHLLSNYGGILIDEAHERSIHIDILIKLVFDIVSVRPEFKVIIMSATINKDIFISYVSRQGLNNKFAIYESIAPTQYEIHIKNHHESINKKNIIPEMYNTIKKILLDKKSRRGDILAFVSSESETNKLSSLINNNYKDFYNGWKPFACAISSKTLDMDKTIAIEKHGLELATSETGRPYNVKVIVATNIAESSMTFKTPVVYVIESGMSYEKNWDALNYVYNGGKTYITQANIKQRCGRTGRTIEGDCIQMYTALQYEKFAKFPAPSITKDDITGELLSILTLPQVNGNLHKALVFIHNLIEPVYNYRDNISVAIRNLLDMDIIAYSNDNPKSLAELTPVARYINRFGKFDIRSGRMVLVGAMMNIVEPVMMLAAIMTTITKIDDLFIIRKNADKKMLFVVEKVKKKWIHSSGDHITLLNIFIHWLNSENRGKLKYDNFLNERILNKIKKLYIELVRIVKSINLNDIELLGIEKVKLPTIKLSEITEHSIEEFDKLQHEPEEPLIEDIDKTGGAILTKKQTIHIKKSSKQYDREEININKYLSAEILDKVMFALAYGYNTNLGYYSPKFNGYQIMNSKYIINMRESVMITRKPLPTYVIYFQAVHQEEKGDTDFQIVSEIKESILTKLVQMKKERNLKNQNIDWDGIKMAINGVKYDE